MLGYEINKYINKLNKIVKDNDPALVYRYDGVTSLKCLQAHFVYCFTPVKKSHGIHLFNHLHIHNNCKNSFHNFSVIIRNRLYNLGFEPTTLWPWLRCYIPELQAHTRYEWTYYKQYVWVHYDPTKISNERLSDKIWLFPIGTIIENIISDIFWGKHILIWIHDRTHDLWIMRPIHDWLSYSVWCVIAVIKTKNKINRHKNQ